MDKFGVFNLIGSLLNKFSAQNPDTSPQKEVSNQQPTNQTQPTFVTQKPLQADMLNTMASHDNFIKRVKQKNKI
ncbi:MAG: hypothetical protein J6R83_03060 [Clostridia bacterium]|nr:hypothetical protein [Clostridia bacterium]